jgi:hypothetical protein
MKLFFYIVLFFSLSVQSQRHRVGAIVSSQRVDAFVLGELKAFPSAMGGGENTTGGNNAAITEVTNTNVSGSGSLRAALESSGDRLIIPTVGGKIDHLGVDNDIVVSDGDITFLGQFAPGDGLIVYGEELEFNNVSEVILRHLRLYLGDDGIGTGKDALRIVNPSVSGSNFILDHLSIHAGDDEVLGIGGSEANASTITGVTVQYSIIGPAFRLAKGMLLGPEMSNISVFNNYLVSNKERNPRSSYGSTDYEFLNNVIYNWDQPPVQATWANKFDIMGNVFVSEGSPLGGATTITYTESGDNGTYIKANTEVYVDGNYRDGILNNALGSDLGTYLQSGKVHNFGTRYINDTPINIRNFVFENVGNNISRDKIDNDLINNALNGTGEFVTTESQTTTVPEYSSGTLLNPDGDYIPNQWKIDHGLTPGVNYFNVKPDFFYIESTGKWYDNRERTGGTYDGYEYTGGTLTGNNIYTWFWIYAEDLAKGFQTMHYN